MRFAHTKDAVWTCGVVDVLCQQGRLRSALVVVTPFHRHFFVFRHYRPREERLRASAGRIVELYERERWYRKPRIIESVDSSIVRGLASVRGLDVTIRRTRASSKLVQARSQLAEWVNRVGRPRRR